MTDAAFETGDLRGLPSRLAELLPAGAPRFLVAGGLASLVNWLVRFPLSLVLPFGTAVGAAYAVGMLVGFVLYRSWVFPGSTLPLAAQIGRFVLVNAAGLAVVVMGAKGLVAVLMTGGLPGGPAEAAAHAGAIVLGALVNFAGHRALTFARRGPAAA